MTKELVNQHGGTVDVESEVGHGATFTVRLPLKEGNEPSSQPA
ncbi:MAG TPA: ATP-binding protein [Chloroflexota bacterium]|nr:ATP-binding protein [Chloroflexota bacterium]